MADRPIIFSGSMVKAPLTTVGPGKGASCRTATAWLTATAPRPSGARSFTRTASVMRSATAISRRVSSCATSATTAAASTPATWRLGRTATTSATPPTGAGAASNGAP